jgi:hypothetical protein
MTPRTTTAGVLVIEHATTADLDGQPWPPTGLMDGWHLVRSADGETLWRRISLATLSDDDLWNLIDDDFWDQLFGKRNANE